ncbi:MAG: PhpK family radical SAM P-methyltransferase [Candidatus Aminicenantes bacterium]|nr:PhpK family radical SAM P-methyltransferase [Candidatus Aminicenantes bacterium]NIM83457.1 PhpK family radical SAM P-methyltransferase [Candidatus Aminicenantes bacterium]NIN22849.1 PhpK family radical SAM P-methyltransferase [Candidatus Aminicenantes bacterium]NIN46585.1 PhpK family radical SAM P-methyltransferase [Candidatus Aminicenantes bacterium]NIN89488.1 PhpK family radical SAM P-methyltransferase [Candidatus Aminicenantes bacterium]
MNKTIDCLLIGYHEVDFTEHVKMVRKLGENSGIFHKLNLDFIQYNNKPYHLAGIFNLLCREDSSLGSSIKPVHMGDTFSLAISYLGTYLQRRGFKFDYVNTVKYEKEELVKKLREENILTIAITTTYYVTPLPILEIMNIVKEHNRTARVIIGGPFIASQVRTQDPKALEYTFDSLGADFYVNSSQGETSLVKIINALKNNLPLSQINNIYYKTDKGYRATPVVREDNKLSENIPGWEMFKDSVGEYVNIRTSISCPFSCSFCGFPEFAGKYRTVDVHTIEQELDLVSGIESVKSVHFIDDTFNVPVERFKNFLKMMVRKKYTFKWHSFFRCQYADRETVELMKESGCEGVYLGLESGSNQMLKKMNKSAVVEDYFKGIALLKEYEILNYGSFILGFPGETYETVLETIKLIKESELDFYQCKLWFCDPIAPIMKEKEKYNIACRQYEWSHNTMNFRKAYELVDEIFLSIDKSIRVPDYGFDFPTVFHLTNRGLDLEQVKCFIKCFNEGVKEKIKDPCKRDVSPEAVEKLRKSLTPNYKECFEEPISTVSVSIPEDSLTVDFDLD